MKREKMMEKSNFRILGYTILNIPWIMRRPEAIHCGGKWVRHAESGEAELSIGQIVHIFHFPPAAD